MTEEEKLDLAIDWIRSQGWNEETLPSDELLQMEKAFLAGLKAKTQWHDLRENPDDLPKDRHNVWIVYLNGYYQKEETVASYRHKYWVISGNKTECEVIAWCELPTFDKE